MQYFCLYINNFIAESKNLKINTHQENVTAVLELLIENNDWGSYSQKNKHKSSSDDIKIKSRIIELNKATTSLIFFVNDPVT